MILKYIYIYYYFKKLKLKLIKSYFRSIELAIFSIENEMLAKPQYKNLIRNFACPEVRII
jgi:hypothetical protein